VWFFDPDRDRYRGHFTFLLNIALIVFGFFDPQRERDRGHSTFLLNIALIVFGFLDPERERGDSTFLLNIASSVGDVFATFTSHRDYAVCWCSRARFLLLGIRVRRSDGNSARFRVPTRANTSSSTSRFCCVANSQQLRPR
jgi:uncharacterized membrane protein YqaE (UPF0057 family)